MARIASISGSPVESSRTSLLAAWAGTWLEARGYEVDAIDVRDISPEALVYARLEDHAVSRAVSIVEQAQGIIIATPIYKAAYSGVIKLFLDLLPQFGLSGKVVLPLAIGGTLAHVLTIDYALRPVLSSLGATHVTCGLFFVNQQIERAEGGGLTIEKQAQERLEGVLQGFADSVRMHHGAGDPAKDLYGRTPVAISR